MNGINKNRPTLFTGEGSYLPMTKKTASGKTLQRKLLALLLLALFLAPGLIQVFHHHEHEGIHVHSDQGGLLSKYEHCAICSFEFVSFLKSEPVFVSKGDFTHQSLSAGLCEAPVRSHAFILSDRAPPLS